MGYLGRGETLSLIFLTLMQKSNYREISSYLPSFHVLSEAQKHLLIEEINWRQDEIKLFGKTHPVPRKHAWYADPDASYSYSGIELPINPWTEQLLELKEKVETVCEQRFNGVLLNLYSSGSHSNGWHSDDERELIRPITVASLSYGQERDFQLRRKDSSRIDERVLLEDGSLFIMRPPFQEQWQHKIAKTKKKIGERVNLTFRLVDSN